jgi:hypothetical protein
MKPASSVARIRVRVTSRFRNLVDAIAEVLLQGLSLGLPQRRQPLSCRYQPQQFEIIAQNIIRSRQADRRTQFEELFNQRANQQF